MARRTLPLLAAVALLALTAHSTSAMVPDGPAEVRASARLPGHFGIGVTASPPDSSTGWMPLSYAKGAAGNGYIPVFPYYMLLQSNGPCDGCGEAERDLAHLDSPPLMRTYYADFAKLMQRLGPGTHDGVEGFGGRAVVHVEPDLSGYAEQAVLPGGSCYGHCTRKGNDPSHLEASVASSGFAAVHRYPNTYRGFNLALLHLRDLFAPNVILAFHVSDWARSEERRVGKECRSRWS